MSRRPSRVSVDTRQNDTLLEFETFKKKFLLANKHITKLNSTLSVRIEELNAQISSLYVENLRLRASEIALASQLKKEREKARKVLDDAEAATHALMKQLGHIRKAHHISRESSSPEPEPAPVPRARRPVIDPNASPPLNRIARAPTVPALFEEDEDEDEDVQSSPTPRRRKSKSRSSSSATGSNSRLPLPTRTSSPPPDHTPLKEFEDQLIRAGKKKPTRRQSGLLTASMSITTATPSGFKTEHHIAPRPPSPAFGSPLRRDAALEEEQDQALAEMDAAFPDREDDAEELVAPAVTKRRRRPKDDDDNDDDYVPPKKENDRRKSKYKGDDDDDDRLRRERDKRRSRDREEGAAPSSYEGKKPRLKDVTNSPPARLSLATTDIHDRERQRTPITDPSPSSATSSSSQSARTFITTPATTPPESHLPTPRASSPLSVADDEPAGARERRVRKSINYAEPKLNTKMRKPDPPPPPPGTLKRPSSAGEHAPRRSLEKSTSADSLASRHSVDGAAAGVKRKKSRAHVPADGDESDGGQADGEGGVRAPGAAAAWVAEGRRRSAVASVARRAESEERRHSVAV
ncbi:hypothetical protein PsYK624_042280 [Phanerochaete sordida]|uniref:Shugoshin C-terminal domain-containing protein n=1 Tax=Phanerochaete sordida TaxID=48140 RepID=A0A9P3G5D7_9APHY|nr:hypothetical protein PsYK624_042280 [Phanerochaete sordida]